MAKIKDISPKLNIPTLENELIFPIALDSNPNNVFGGMSAGSRELTHGKISIQGVDERMLFGDVEDYSTGAGVYIGRDPSDGAYKFRAGDPSSQVLEWDGSSLNIGGFIEEGGAAADVNSGITTISGGKITTGSITATQIASNAVTADKILANAVTAAKINVSELSAISADIGDVTAGTITGVVVTGGTVRTSSSGQRVELTSGDYISLYNSGGTEVGRIYASGGDMYFNSFYDILFNASGGFVDFGGAALTQVGLLSVGANGIIMNDYDITEIDELRGDDGYIDMNSGNSNTQTENFDPKSSGTYNLGGSSRYWNYLNCVGVTYHSMGYYDDGVTFINESGEKEKVGDVEAIKRLYKPHPTQKTRNGVPLLDKSKLPVEMFVPAQDHEGNEYPRDDKGVPIVTYKEKMLDEDGNVIRYKIGENKGKPKYKTVTKKMPEADGQDGTQLLALALGAIKELSEKIEVLEGKI